MTGDDGPARGSGEVLTLLEVVALSWVESRLIDLSGESFLLLFMEDVLGLPTALNPCGNKA